MENPRRLFVHFLNEKGSMISRAARLRSLFIISKKRPCLYFLEYEVRTHLLVLSPAPFYRLTKKHPFGFYIQRGRADSIIPLLQISQGYAACPRRNRGEALRNS